MVDKTISKCAKCSYPLAAAYEGEKVSCPNCGTINEAITGVEIPTPLFIGLLAFGFGMFLGPSIAASTTAGRDWLGKKARGG